MNEFGCDELGKDGRLLPVLELSISLGTSKCAEHQVIYALDGIMEYFVRQQEYYVRNGPSPPVHPSTILHSRDIERVAKWFFEKYGPKQ